MEKIKKTLGRLFGDMLIIAGAASIAIGVGLYSFPAGLITAGILAIAGAVLSSMDGGDAK